MASGSGRCMRKKSRVNYKDLAEIKLPREKRRRAVNSSDQLFPVSVVERKESQVKIHYVGYTSIHDEWRDIDELELLDSGESREEDGGDNVLLTPFQSHSLYKDLSIKIKQGLTCGRKNSPIIRLVMSFDLIQFNGGLKECGILSRKFHGVQRYKIKHYRDLDNLLGKNWHYRGLNVNGDYGYAVRDTIEFYIYKSRPLKEYIPSSGSDPISQSAIDTGHALVFSFICKCGSPSSFGKDRDVFFA